MSQLSALLPSKAGLGFWVWPAAFYATIGLATGIGMPFFPLWLEYKGFNASEIGIILATPMIVRVLCVPLTMRLADRTNMLRTGMFLAAVGSALGNMAMLPANTLTAMVATMALAAVFFAPGYPLTDAYVLRALTERKGSYGSVRLWSSVAYIVANVSGGYLIGMIGRANILWLIIGAFVIGAVSALGLKPLAAHHTSADSPRPSSMVLWRSRVFVAMLVACSVSQSSHAVYYGFSTLGWTNKGFTDTTIGMLWAIGVIAEICLFLGAGFLSRFIGPIAWVILGAAGGIVRWGGLALDPPFAVLPFLQCLHALTFTATLMGTMQFLARNVPPGLGGTAQGDFAAAQGLVFGAATVVSGMLFRSYGDLSYIAMAVLSALALAVAIMAYVFARAEPPPDTRAAQAAKH
jgi:PPP family 3-phenylpropionic acid transporter